MITMGLVYTKDRQREKGEAGNKRSESYALSAQRNDRRIQW